MQPALAVGTLLQNRYRIAQLLGQGGFGRTYLTKDQGRFEEECVIKEFMPVGGGDRFSSKAAQLFQREAETLYQISHPQIPQFRASFEQDQRLFLVQDYIEGLTYREILQQRPGQAFSETEIRAFLGQLLPVLAHIHAKGIIHRDISPENIILRRSDQRPVLIDFGVVKEVVTRLQTDATTTQATTVGKAGYAPSEQIQSGRAYPSSDLYALAVTVLVLMTGKEPHELFDDTTLSWNWQPFTQVSDQLATVLNKALSYRPSDRYQSVSEMAQALQQGGSAHAVSSAPPQSPTRRPTPQHQPISEMRTVAVGSNPTATQTGTTDMGGTRSAAAKTTASRTQVVTSPSDQRGMDNPLALAAMFLGATALAGFGGWATVNYVLKPDPPSQNEVIQPLPPPEELENQNNQPDTPEPKPLEPEEPTNYTSALELAEGDQKTVEGGIKKGDTVNYAFEGKAGQTLRTALTGDGVVLSVLDADGKELRGGRRVSDWQGELPEDGRYTVQVRTARGTDQSTYGLTLGLEAAAPDEPGENNDGGDNPPVDDGTDNEGGTDTDGGDTGDEVPEEPDEVPPKPQEQVSSQRVQFPEGATGTLLANSVGPGRVQRYLVNAQQGQIVTVKITQASGPVTFDVAFPGGEQIADAEGVLYWNSYLPLGGDYAIDVKSASAAEFTLDVQVVGQGTASP
ncbi:serine/threonine protein kinase [Leptolyngbya cf. ectocarpi LEGE 11479]|uniref:non-specific serine/threonine protein kinase n=1 Tax=Leptolyngbya cf. ectocarpi LEGE 11479 TaxID=1828722 RepID=A0A928ZZQ5_LEPEC|nr:serine/threonine-protein kinase [Leptolyngbya ectocarpi]MBE9070422.1 serine/threonine protein kinase [Leptolyngbya cf. ectocarpi LEGE 11479]